MRAKPASNDDRQRLGWIKKKRDDYLACIRYYDISHLNRISFILDRVNNNKSEWEGKKDTLHASQNTSATLRQYEGLE